MIIDKDNFLDIFPIIKEKLNNAVFISIDEEMTGIMSNEKSNKNSKVDNADSRYKKMATVANKYSIIQFGLCIFEKDEDDEYIVSPYNFYLFPAANSYTDIVMSPSSIDFLRTHHMDFQSWITKGINFVDDKGQTYLERKYNQIPSPPPPDATSTNNSNNDTATATAEVVSVPAAAVPKSKIVLTAQSDIDYMERNVLRLNEMIKSSTSTSTSTESIGAIACKKYIFEQSNAFLRRAVYEYLDLNCPPPLFSLSKTADFCICVTMLESSADKELLDRKLHDENIHKFQQEMGFKLLFNELSKCRKPIIGHNCMFDFMFMMRHFHQTPLEADMSEFKKSFQNLFPTVFDTKFIATSGIMHGIKYDNTVLEELYKFIQTLVPVITLTEKKKKNKLLSSDGSSVQDHSSPSKISSGSTTTNTTATANLRQLLDTKLSLLNNSISHLQSSVPTLNESEPITIVFAEDVPPYAEQDKYHDAGWDAYCTGVIFAAQMKLVGANVEKMSELAGNKLFMMQSLYHMDLHPAHTNDFLKSDGYVFYLSNFPATTVTDDILAVFTKLGYNVQPNVKEVELIWVDGTSTFVALSSSSSSSSTTSITTATAITADEELEKKALQRIEEHLPFGWMIETLKQYRHKQSMLQTQQSSRASITQVSSRGNNGSNSSSSIVGKASSTMISTNDNGSDNNSISTGNLFLDMLATPFVYVADSFLGRKRKLSIGGDNSSK